MSDPTPATRVDKTGDGQAGQTPKPAPAAYSASASPAAPPAALQRRWSALTCAAVVNASCTLVALGASLFLGLRSLRVSEESLRATSESLRQNNLATIYTLGGELTKFDQENPKLSEFFEAEARKPWATEEALWGEYEKLPKGRKTCEVRDEYAKMWADYKALDKDEQVKVYMTCQRIADFSQIAFVQRHVLPDDDWDTWWNYITDQYDESPLYRVFLSRRPGWYAFLDAVKPENRAKYYRSGQKQ
jgi:hypothetical protein